MAESDEPTELKRIAEVHGNDHWRNGMIQSSGKRVLVVEDEPLLMMMAIDIVEGAGLEAIEATNAQDAIIILEARTDIAVIMTDVEMPGTMNGLRLAASIHHRWPLVGIIVVSGRVSVGVADLPENGIFFQKPYDAEALAHAVRTLAA